MWWAMWLGMLKGLWYIPLSLEPRQDPVGAFGIQSSGLFSYTVCMKNSVVESGDFITISGIYRTGPMPAAAATANSSCQLSEIWLVRSRESGVLSGGVMRVWRPFGADMFLPFT
jgi:hypothetical protein